MTNPSTFDVNKLTKLISEIESSKYSKFLKEKWIDSLQIGLLNDTPPAAKKAIFESVSDAFAYYKIYKKESSELLSLKEQLKDKTPATLIIHRLCYNFTSAINLLDKKFQQCYQEGKEKGSYPEKMNYFDWLWHEFEVLKSSQGYFEKKATDELEKSLRKD